MPFEYPTYWPAMFPKTAVDEVLRICVAGVQSQERPILAAAVYEIAGFCLGTSMGHPRLIPKQPPKPRSVSRGEWLWLLEAGNALDSISAARADDVCGDQYASRGPSELARLVFLPMLGRLLEAA